MARAKIPAWQPFKFDPTKDESGTWIVRSRYNDDAGMRHDIKRSGRTKGAADLALRRAVKDAQQQYSQRKEDAEKALTQVKVLTLRELSEPWLEVRKPAPVKIDMTTQTGTPSTNELRMQTWVSYEGNLRHHILPALGQFAVDKLKTPDCEAAIQGMFDKEAGTGYRTAAMAKQVLSQILDYAVRQGHWPDNPSDLSPEFPIRASCR